MNMRRMQRICSLLLPVTLCLLLSGCDALVRLVRQPGDMRVARAVEALGLEGVSFWDFNAIHMGDGLSAFCMPHYYSHEDPRDLREEALAKLRTAPGWHVEAVDAARVTALMQRCCSGVALFPAEGVSFQAWFCEQEGEYPEMLPCELNGQWTLGFFCQEEGWWLYVNGEGFELGEGEPMEQAGPIAITAAYQPVDDGPWVAGEITREELVRLMKRTQEEVWPRLYPAAGIVFDCWRWEDRSVGKAYDWDMEAFLQVLQNAGIQDSRDWVLTLRDEETGLQIRYEYKG